MRIALRVLIAVGALAVLAVVAVAIAVATIDVNLFAGAIRQRISDATGRDVSIGKIRITRTLSPHLVVEDVAVANAPWGKAPHLLTAKRVEAQVALVPLLQRRIEIAHLELFEPVIALEAASGGRANWTFDGKRVDAGAAPVEVPAEAAVPAALAVGDLALTGGVVTWRDGAAATPTTIAVDRLAVVAPGPQAPIDVEFRGAVDGTPLELKGAVGSLSALRQGRSPYPVQVGGRIDGRPAALATKVTRTDGGYRLDELEATYGANTLRGTVSAFTNGPRARFEFKLAATTIAVADVPAAVPAAPAPVPAKETAAPGTAPAKRPAPATGAPPRAWVFGTDPVRLTPLPAFDLDGDLAIEQVTLKGGRSVVRVRARIALHDGRADVSSFEAAVFGGTVRGHVTVDGGRDGQAHLALRFDAKGLDLAALLAAFDVQRQIRGGKTDVTADLALHGASPRQWASTVNGSVTATVGPGTIVNGRIDNVSAFNKLAAAVNPFRELDAATELRCAVIRLPLANGVARIERSIAMETGKVGVAATGTLDFRDETMDLSLRPRVLTSISGRIVQFVGPVRLRGPFAAPAVVIDPKGSIETVARVGAAYATGGLSVLGEAVLDHGGAGGGECATATGGGPAQRPAGR
jgi:AsmA family protein